MNDMAAQTMAALDLSDEEWDAIPENVQAKITSAMETRAEVIGALYALLSVINPKEAVPQIEAARAAIAKATE